MRRERGSAVLMAMLVVVAATTLVTGALWQQSALVREAENDLALAQARWLLHGAIDWAGAILREDARTSSVDHRGEPWAVPLADTRLNENDGRPPAYLAGAIVDEQGKLNLRNLVVGDTVAAAQLNLLRRLLAALQINQAYADAIAARVLSATRERRDHADLGRAFADPLLQVGLEPAALERLRPLVTVLPESTPLNVNTAPAEVLLAAIPGLTLIDAKRLVASRDRAYFKDLGDAVQRLREVVPNASDNGLAVATRYFSVEGAVTYGRARLAARALVKRETGRVEVLWVREAS